MENQRKEEKVEPKRYTAKKIKKEPAPNCQTEKKEPAPNFPGKKRTGTKFPWKKKNRH